VIVNLEPAKIRGVESNGMLLAASKGEKLVVLTVDSEIDSGARIS
jgi:methionyl-tRNA synthetase